MHYETSKPPPEVDNGPPLRFSRSEFYRVAAVSMLVGMVWREVLHFEEAEALAEKWRKGGRCEWVAIYSPRGYRTDVRHDYED